MNSFHIRTIASSWITPEMISIPVRLTYLFYLYQDVIGRKRLDHYLREIIYGFTSYLKITFIIGA